MNESRLAVIVGQLCLVAVGWYFLWTDNLSEAQMWIWIICLGVNLAGLIVNIIAGLKGSRQ